MNKRSWIFLLVIAIVVLVALAGGVGWVWALGATSPLAVTPVSLEVTNGSVQVKHPGADWQAVSSTLVLATGDEIRTMSDGQATVTWADRGETRLDPGTDLTITQVSQASSSTDVHLSLTLQTGRIWSRFLKLLDVGSDTSVTNQAVVATVRGTAFGVEATSTGMDVAVTDSVVDIGGSASSTLVREGRWGSFSSTGTPLIVRDLEASDTWPLDADAADAAFNASLHDGTLSRFDQLALPSPTGLAELGESLRLMFASAEERRALESEILVAHIATSVLHPTDASELLNQDKLWKDLHASKDADALRAVNLALATDAPSSDDFSEQLMQSLETLRRDLLSATPVDDWYARALTVDDQIDIILQDPHLASGDRGLRVSGALRDISDLQNDIPGLNATPEIQARLMDKVDALRERLRGVGEAAASSPAAAVPVAPTSTAAGTPTSTLGTPSGLTVSTAPNPAAPTSTNPTTSTAPVKPRCVSPRGSVVASPASAYVGERVTLAFFELCTDGTRTDVTQLTAFNSASLRDGQFMGNIFIPSHAGTINLSAAATVDGVALTGTYALQVTAPSTSTSLSGVGVIALGPTSLTTGQTVPLQATATYSDGSKTDVTYQCRWSTSDPRMAVVSTSGLFQHLKGTGSVDAICDYTEAGIAVEGRLTFTITLNAQLTPSGGSPAPAPASNPTGYYLN